MKKTIRARPRIQREFLAWFRQNAGRFAIPLRITARKRKRIEFSFVGITPIISGALNDHEVYVKAEMNGRRYDWIVEFDAYLRHSPQGYYCALYYPESRVFHRTRQEFWRIEIFERFLAWVNAKFAPARWVRLSDYDDGGFIWAELILDENDLARHELDLQLINGQPFTRENGTVCRNWLIPLRTQP